MRNKKYRKWKVVLDIIIIAICLLGVSVLVKETWEKIIMYVGSAILVGFIPMVISQFFEINSDRMVTRGTISLNKAYDKSFKKCVFMFDDLADISVECNKVIWLHLKDGTNVTIPLGGFFKKREIVGLIYEVRAQIKGYEQNK